MLSLTTFIVFPTFLSFLKSAGPARETKADKRKKEKKGNKGGGTANRPSSGKPGRREAQTSSGALSDQNKLTLEQNGERLASENNEQSAKGVDRNGANEMNVLEQNSTNCLPESAANEDSRESKTMESEGRREESAASIEKPRYGDDEKSLTGNEEEVNTEEHSARAVKIEGRYHFENPI